MRFSLTSMNTCLIVEGSPIRLGTATGGTMLPSTACLTSESAPPQPFCLKTCGVYVALISASLGRVNRVSEAVVPWVP